MKGLIHWFKNSTRMKRWIFLIIIGMILVCYGFSKVFILETLGIKELAQIVVSFVVGFICFIIGLIYIQRRTLELVIEENSKSKLDNNVQESGLKSVISKKTIYEKGPKIVVIGGGNGLNNVLKGLKRYTSNITAIVPVSSYGKQPTKENKQLNLKPVEEIKQSLIALSLDDEKMQELLKYKFDKGSIKGLEFGDIYLSAMQEIYGDFASGIQNSSNMLSMVGKVLPVTLDEMKICVELQDGTVIEEKDKLVEISANRVTEVNKVYISPTNCRTTKGVVEEIKDADCIIIGPGSLYTNVIPSLLIKNVAKAIKESKAQKVYISNIMTEPGQTDDYDVSNHIKAIFEHAGKGIINYAICDTGEIIPEFIRKYNLNGSNLVNIDTSKIKELGVNIIKENVAGVEADYIRHDSSKIAKIIMELLFEEIKFKDKSKDEQYMLINTKLKDENKKAKGKKSKRLKKETKSKHAEGRKTSKFNSKYEERIKSIKNTEKTRQENIKIHKKAEKLINEEESKEKDKFLKETYDIKNKK